MTARARRHGLTVLALTAALAALPPADAGHRAGQRPPNIVFVLADDLGWTDLGCTGSKYYETPHLDRLAREGMHFTSAYTSGPNCAPTRACLMTGRYTPRHGIYTVGTGERGAAANRKLRPVANRTDLPPSEVVVAQALKAAGYVTGMFGKWHLGQKGDYHPSRRGFDRAVVSMGKHFDFTTQPKVKVAPGTYLADFLTDKALDFIEENKDRPFFLYLPHFGVHSPYQAKKNWLDHFHGKQGVGGHDDPTYAAMIASVDESVGRVLDRLADLKLDENTVILFSSDNGGVGGYAAAGIAGARGVTTNLPLRAGKGTLYEGGVRVPFLVRWKGTIRPGSRCDTPIISVDLFPTLVELAGGKAGPKNGLDGVSLAALLQSSGQDELDRDALFWHFPGYLEAGKADWRTTPAGSIRRGDWKLLEFFEDGRLELYNLKDDLGQKNDLARSRPDLTRELHERLRAWRSAVNAPMPGPAVPPRQG